MPILEGKIETTRTFVASQKVQSWRKKKEEKQWSIQEKKKGFNEGRPFIYGHLDNYVDI